MKVDNVEITGIDHVVIYQKIIYDRNGWEWTRKGKPSDTMDHAAMVKKIKKFTYSPWHRVWISGSYVNILPWNYDKKAHDQ